jgi:hypothetical protein
MRPEQCAWIVRRTMCGGLAFVLHRTDDGVDDALRSTVLRRGHATLAAQLALGINDNDLDLRTTEVHSTHALTHGRRAYHVAKWRRSSVTTWV